MPRISLSGIRIVNGSPLFDWTTAMLFSVVPRCWRIALCRHETHAVPSYTSIDGHQFTVHAIRNFDYRTETDFDMRYYDKTFDLDKLRLLDLAISYRAGPHIAHKPDFADQILCLVFNLTPH